jgi:hypothetical protein
VRTIRKLTFALLAAAVLLTGSIADARVDAHRARPALVDSCTLAEPASRATIEAHIANAADFCELVSQALAGDVFRAPMLVTPGRVWHYADGAVSCRLWYGHTRYRMTIRNSAAACRWLTRPATRWHREPARSGYVQ